MDENHYIYLLFDHNNQSRYLSNEVHKIGRKIGSTCNMKTRMKPYLTGHPDKVPLECYYKILNPELYSCYEIDNMIKNEFDEFRLKGSGGIEFYEVNKVTQEVLEKYFDKMGITWQKLYEVIDEDNQIITKKDIENLSFDIEHRNYYQDIPIKKYDLLNKYIEQIKERNIVKDLINLDENVINYILEHYDDSLITELKSHQMIDDQIEVILCSIIYFNKKDKGIWNLFCRYGKTMLSSLFCHYETKYRKILVLVPSLYLVNQTYNTWIKYWDKKIIKRVSCEEGLSDDEEILNFYNNNDKCIIISTYHSSEKLKDYEFDICIYDEAHRTAGEKFDEKNNEDNDTPKIKLFKLLLESSNIKQKLFLTATKKIYNNDEDNIYCMDDENIYGKTIASVSAIGAKKLNRICPYKIMTIKAIPIEIEFDIEKFFEDNKLKENQKKILIELKDRYIMFAKGLIDCMRENKIKHVITFHEYIINCKFFCQILKHIDKEKILKNTEYISGCDNKKLRNEIIDDFQKNDYSVLCSAKVLQEGVDIPKCDGVIFIDNKTSNIDITQSLSRCLTYLENKNAYIMIPYIDGEDLKNDVKTNDLRLLLRNISEIDENIQEYFKEYNKIKGNSESENTEKELKELNIKYNINIELNFIEQMREISYLPYKQAKEFVNGRFDDHIDYKNRIEELSKDLPIDADIIYNRFGWENWNDYLGLESKMNSFRISKLIQNENDRRKKILNCGLKIKESIKYILKLENREMSSEEICNKILELAICKSLNCIDKQFSINHNCCYLVKEKIISTNENFKPRKYSYNGYNEFELIDSKQKYIEYCKNINTELEQNIEPNNGNWIKFCLKDYDELVKSHYTINELKEKKILSCNDYDQKCFNDSKFISRKYIENGFYNSITFKLSDIYFSDENNEEYYD